MGTVEDYRTGRIVEGISKAELVLGDRDALASGDPVFELIRQSKILAVGERVCLALHPESPETQTVFLDELAEAMIGAGKATAVDTSGAESVIERQSSRRIIASMVAGRYLELCAAWPPDCIFCKAERAGIRCFGNSSR